MKLSTADVLTPPGHIAVIFRPSLAYSSATLFVGLETPCFAAA
jgi:hypothetical protein